MAVIFLILYFGILVLTLASLWKVFTKAGKPGWAAIIPIYNVIVLLEIVRKPVWWFVLFLIPLVGLFIGIITIHQLSKSFGKDIVSLLGLSFYLLYSFLFLPLEMLNTFTTKILPKKASLIGKEQKEKESY